MFDLSGAGFITFLPFKFKKALKKKIAKAQFTSFIPKRRDIVIIAVANKNLRIGLGVRL